MNKADHPDALTLAKIHAGRLRERNTELMALLYGALSLLVNNDEVNGVELLEIAIDRAGDIGDFQALNKALDGIMVEVADRRGTEFLRRQVPSGLVCVDDKETSNG